MKSKRIQWLDFAKGFLIFTVLVYHSILTSGGINIYVPNNNNNVITSALKLFMMPGFFAISGYLYKPTNTLHKYLLMFYKKFISIMLPGIIFTIIGLISQDYHILINVLFRWYDLFLCQYGDTWFLTTLFFIFMIAGLLDLLHIPLYFDVFIYISIFIVGIDFPNLSKYPYMVKGIGGSPIKNIGINILFFYLGYLLKKYNIINYLCKMRYIITIGFFWAILMVIEMKYLKAYKQMEWPQTVGSIVSVLLLFVICINLNHNNWLFNFFTKYGKDTLIIYLVHWPIVYFLIPKILIHLNLVNSFTNNMSFLIIAKILIAWLISIIVCYMSNKNCIINFIFYPRKYIDKFINKIYIGRKFLNIQ